jgi:hypothetical protein
MAALLFLCNLHPAAARLSAQVDTSPEAPVGQFQIPTIIPDPISNDVRLEWESQPGLSYGIETKNALDTEWTPITTVPGGPGNLSSFTHTNGSALVEQQFYRVVYSDPVSIEFCLYAVHDNTPDIDSDAKLRLMATMVDGASGSISLNITRDDGATWSEVAQTNVITHMGNQKLYVALFEVNNWDDRTDARYVVAYNNERFGGRIPKNPRDQNEIIMASLSCWKKGKESEAIVIEEVPDALVALHPDILFCSGDQVYSHTRHFSEWRFFGRAFREVLRNIPTVSITDDHDTGTGNLWGSAGSDPLYAGLNGYDASGGNLGLSGSKSEHSDDGGYEQSFDYVNAVQFSQSGVLPDPPTYPDGFDHDQPVQQKRPQSTDTQDLNAHYTALNWGGISYAILEDRKFKHGPEETFRHLYGHADDGSKGGIATNGVLDYIDVLGPYFSPGKAGRDDGFRWDHMASTPPVPVEHADSRLLGQRQLDFLDYWAQDWRDADMKVVLQQTVFVSSDGKDLDTNAWPKIGRTRALKTFRKAFAFSICGDQHFGLFGHYGIDEWEDAGYFFAVPSLDSTYARNWNKTNPEGYPENWPPEMAGSDLFGRFHCNLDTKVTVWSKSGSNYEGFGIIRFNKANRTITSEYWNHKEKIDPLGGSTPTLINMTVNQQDNYGRQAAAWLPTIQVEGATNPVVQIINEATGDVEYTLRIPGTEFQPKVFAEGNYTIKVDGEDLLFGNPQVFSGIIAATVNTNTLVVSLP